MYPMNVHLMLCLWLSEWAVGHTEKQIGTLIFMQLKGVRLKAVCFRHPHSWVSQIFSSLFSAVKQYFPFFHFLWLFSASFMLSSHFMHLQNTSHLVFGELYLKNIYNSFVRMNTDVWVQAWLRDRCSGSEFSPAYRHLSHSVPQQANSPQMFPLLHRASFPSNRLLLGKWMQLGQWGVLWARVLTWGKGLNCCAGKAWCHQGWRRQSPPFGGHGLCQPSSWIAHLHPYQQRANFALSSSGEIHDRITLQQRMSFIRYS